MSPIVTEFSCKTVKTPYIYLVYAYLARSLLNITITMKKDTHPQFFDEAVVTCSCGATHTIGATIPELKVEICSNCHPFYTGKQKLVDTEGRVDKFYARMNKSGVAALAKAPVSVEKKEEKSASDATEEAAA